MTYKENILKNTVYLPSEINFYRGMKVKDTIKYSAELRKSDCSKKAAMLSERLPIASIMKVTGKDYAAICKIAEENGLVICQ